MVCGVASFGLVVEACFVLCVLRSLAVLARGQKSLAGLGLFVADVCVGVGVGVSVVDVAGAALCVDVDVGVVSIPVLVSMLTSTLETAGQNHRIAQQPVHKRQQKTPRQDRPTKAKKPLRPKKQHRNQCDISLTRKTNKTKIVSDCRAARRAPPSGEERLGAQERG